MIIVKTVLYLIKQLVHKARAPKVKDVMVCAGVISVVGLVCLMIGHKAAA